MNILIEIGETTCLVPASGEVVSVANGSLEEGWLVAVPVRLVGFSDLSLDAFLRMREQQILSLIPLAPAHTTVADLMAHTGMKRNAIRSLLMEFDAAGLIESQRPRVHQNRGATTRRYWRAR
jgi:hypothetical protein